MISPRDMDLFRRIILRKGFHLLRWSPDIATRIDRLVAANLITWRTDSNYPGRSKIRLGTEPGVTQCVQRHMGIRLELTKKGLIMRNKL